MLDLLDVTDPDILNTLIDQRGVELDLLIETKAHARRVMERERPYNARSVRTCCHLTYYYGTIVIMFLGSTV